MTSQPTTSPSLGGNTGNDPLLPENLSEGDTVRPVTEPDHGDLGDIGDKPREEEEVTLVSGTDVTLESDMRCSTPSDENRGRSRSETEVDRITVDFMENSPDSKAEKVNKGGRCEENQKSVEVESSDRVDLTGTAERSSSSGNDVTDRITDIIEVAPDVAEPLADTEMDTSSDVIETSGEQPVHDVSDDSFDTSDGVPSIPQPLNARTDPYVIVIEPHDDSTSRSIQSDDLKGQQVDSGRGSKSQGSSSEVTDVPWQGRPSVASQSKCLVSLLKAGEGRPVSPLVIAPTLSPEDFPVPSITDIDGDLPVEEEVWHTSTSTAPKRFYDLRKQSKFRLSQFLAAKGKRSKDVPAERKSGGDHSKPTASIAVVRPNSEVRVKDSQPLQGGSFSSWRSQNSSVRVTASQTKRSRGTAQRQHVEKVTQSSEVPQKATGAFFLKGQKSGSTPVLVLDNEPEVVRVTGRSLILDPTIQDQGSAKALVANVKVLPARRSERSRKERDDVSKLVVTTQSPQMDVCPKCHLAFSVRDDWLKHRVKCFGESHLMYYCNRCPQSFGRHRDWVAHRKTHVLALPKWMCDRCYQRFNSRRDLRDHKAECMGPEEGAEKPRFQCEDCGKSFPYPSALKVHSETHVLKHKCPICGQCFTRFYEMTKHVRKRHSEVETHSCEHCGKVFNRLTMLYRHKSDGLCFPDMTK